MPEIERRWYVVHTRSNFEKRVSADLSAKGLESYLPSFRQIHQWKDRKKAVELPVFPGYVFVRMSDTGESRLSVLRAAGAVRLLGNGAGLEPVPETELDSVRKLVDSGMPFSLHPFLREGTRVRVTGGALDGVEGILATVKNQARLVISVETLSSAVSVEVDAARVEAVRPWTRTASSGWIS